MNTESQRINNAHRFPAATGTGIRFSICFAVELSLVGGGLESYIDRMIWGLVNPVNLPTRAEFLCLDRQDVLSTICGFWNINVWTVKLHFVSHGGSDLPGAIRIAGVILRVTGTDDLINLANC